MDTTLLTLNDRQVELLLATIDYYKDKVLSFTTNADGNLLQEVIDLQQDITSQVNNPDNTN